MGMDWPNIVMGTPVVRRGPRASAFVLSTKVGRWMDLKGKDDGSGYVGGLPHTAARHFYDGTMRSFEQLQAAGLDRIDILLIHDVDV